MAFASPTIFTPMDYHLNPPGSVASTSTSSQNTTSCSSSGDTGGGGGSGNISCNSIGSSNSSGGGGNGTYEDSFPALPLTSSSDGNRYNDLNGHDNYSINKKQQTMMKIKPSIVTHVVKIPADQRRLSDFNIISDTMYHTQNIMKQTGTKIELNNSKDGTLTVVITGKEDAVLRAKKLIMSDMQAKTEAIIRIPKDHHKFILGKSGKKLTEIEKNTGTKITLPPMDSGTENITVSGTKDSIERAIDELRTISEQVAMRSAERISIEKKYHPFINGPDKATIKQIMLQTGAKIAIPPNSAETDEIAIYGESSAVERAKRKILDIYEDKKLKATKMDMQLKKERHKYLIGPKGKNLQELFAKTGVYVTIPSPESGSDTVTLFGDQQKIGEAMKFLYDKAHEVYEDFVDVEPWIIRHIMSNKSRFPELQAHLGKNKMENGVRNSDIHVFLPQDKERDGRIKIEGKIDDVIDFKKKLLNEIESIKNEVYISELRIEPKYHRFIIGKDGKNISKIRDETKVHISVPNAFDNTNNNNNSNNNNGGGNNNNSNNNGNAGNFNNQQSTGGVLTDVIRIEGGEHAVKIAKEMLEDIIRKQKEREAEITKELKIEQRFHGQLIGSKGEKIKEVRQRFNQVAINFPQTSIKSDIVTVRGVAQDVNNCIEYLKYRFDELLSTNHREEVPINETFHKMVIGKEKSQIGKIRDETETKIEMPPAGSKTLSIIIFGKREDCRKAREAIVKLQKELSDCITREIIIPSRYHKDLIGFKGRCINTLRTECGNVDIQFPSESSNSEKVTIVGPKEMVTKAKQQLIDLKNELEVNNYREEVKAKPSHHKHLIGKNGSNIKRLRDKYKVRIDVPGDNEDLADRETIPIYGKKENVAKAKAELLEQIKDLDRNVQEKVLIPLKYRDQFRKTLIRQIRERENIDNVNVDFGKDSNDENVTVSGLKNAVQSMVEKIKEKVEQLESEVVVQVEYPAYQRLSILRRNLSDLRSEYNVIVRLPQRETANGDISSDNGTSNTSGDGSFEDESGGSRSPAGSNGPHHKIELATIRGTRENVERAKKAFEQLVADFVTEEIQVPTKFHRNIIGPKGSNIRNINDTNCVDINVPPSKDNSDTIKVTGLKSHVADAIKAINSIVKKCEDEILDKERKSFTIELRIDPKHHPKIIGRKGSTVSKIKEKHDVQIKIPERSDRNCEVDLIRVIGYEDNANAARDELMEIVKEAESLVTECVTINPKCFRLLVGSKRKNIMMLNKQFKVDIKIPSTRDPADAPVQVTGLPEDVAAAIEELQCKEEEILEDLEDMYAPPEPPKMNEFVQSKEKKQSRPDTNNVEEFPSMSNESNSGSVQPKNCWDMQGAKVVSNTRN